MNEVPKRVEPWCLQPRRRIVTTLAVCAFLLSGCQSGETAEFVTVELDFSELREDGKTCEAGDPRPCYQPLRTQPNTTSGERINDTISRNGRLYAGWPYEASFHSEGDKLTVVCQVRGEEIEDANGNTSDIWDVVRVSAEHVHESTLAAVRDDPDPDIGIIKSESGEIQAVYAFVPNMWRRNPGTYEQLEPCNQEENPGNYPPVQ